MFRKMLHDHRIDRFPVVAGVDLDAAVVILEELDRGKGHRLEGVEPLLQAFDVVVAASGILRSSEDPLLEHRVWTLEVEHLGEFGLLPEDLVPGLEISQ